MTQSDLNETVVVLDLDDTLYKEIDYKISGIHAACTFIESIYGKSIVSDLPALQLENSADWLDTIIKLVNLPVSAKESLLWVYRLHHPKIKICDETHIFLTKIKLLAKAVLILTDGRSISQRLKLQSLGISNIPVYISEEFSSQKPDTLRFEKIMRDFSAKQYIYIGDNPKKDFIAPNKLGWQTIGLRGNERNIYEQSCEGLPVTNHPLMWINSLNELFEVSC
jgi:putative hydrolase of the HAD superfamily